MIWVYAVTVLERILITVAAVSLSLAGVVIVGASRLLPALIRLM